MWIYIKAKEKQLAHVCTKYKKSDLLPILKSKINDYYMSKKLNIIMLF